MLSRLSLRVRLTIWYWVALLVVLCASAAAVLWEQQRIGLRRVDDELGRTAATVANVVKGELEETGDMKASAEEARATVAAPGRAIAVLTPQGEVLAAAWNGLSLPRFAMNGERVRVWTVQPGSGGWRVRAELAAFNRSPFVVVAGSPLSELAREQREIREAMLIGIPIVLILAGAGGFWLADVGLRPISRMAERAARIPPNGLEDLGESNRTDELGRLATAFNGLVARLRDALGTQRRFMADASHELRTPVSVIRSAADVMLSRERRDEAEYRDALAIVGGEARRLGILVEDMLVLARADAGGYPLRPVDLYLDELVLECQRTVDVVAAARGVHLAVSTPPELLVRGDEDLLRRMILNVLQNAVQHTPEGQTVRVGIAADGGDITVRVRDRGPGIPVEDRQRIFDRFVQLDPSRRGSGTGLGLPIARWIAEAHGGTLDLDGSGPDGSTFVIVLPSPAPAPPPA